MVVVDDAEVAAFAVDGFDRRRRVVLTTGLLALLSEPPLRRAVIEHERSHLRHHHLMFRLAIEFAVRLNPILRPTIDVVEDALERWADADAADRVGADVVARALVTVALAAPSAMSPVALPLTGGQVAKRVAALVDPPRRRGWMTWLVLPVALVAMAAVIALVIDIDLTEDVLHTAADLARASVGR
jgi:beta-lactamase regulating signal transducer with metallopeptidase domain